MLCPEVADLVTSFQSYNKLRNLSHRTIELYQYGLMSFFGSKKLNGGTIKDINTGTLQDYFSSLWQGGSLSPHSVHIHFRSLKTFFNFLSREGHIVTSPFERLLPPRLPRKVMPTLTDDEIKRLIKAPRRNTFAGLRDYTFIVLLLDTGMRVSEAMGIELKHVNLEELTILINGKGNKQRIVPFGLRVRKTMLRYLQKRMMISDYGNLITTSEGLPLEVHSVQVQLARYGKRAAITGKRVSPHKLRHTFAKKYILNGSDPFSLQRILGHTTIDMVRNYVNMFSADLQIQHRKFSPMDRLR